MRPERSRVPAFTWYAPEPTAPAHRCAPHDTVVRITHAHIAAERRHRSTLAFDDAPELLNAVALALNAHLCALGVQPAHETLGRVCPPGTAPAGRVDAVVSTGEYWRPAPLAVTAYCSGEAEAPFRFDLVDGAGWSVSIPDNDMRRTLFGTPADAPRYRIDHHFPLSGRLHEITAIGGSADEPILMARLAPATPVRPALAGLVAIA